jgi:presenilin 1
LVQTAEARGEPIPGLVYSGHQIKLGLGDFVFYSLLVGRASLRSTAALVACAVAVLAGLCATLALLPVLERVLPALPISIALGIMFYFASWLMIEPLAAAAAQRSLFL